ATVVLVAAGQAQAGPAVVSGIVEDALLHPLPGAAVVLHDPSGKTVAQAVTDDAGRFTLAGIPNGDYTVEASAPGLVGDHQHLQLTGARVDAVERVLVSSEEVVSIQEDWAVPAPTKATGSVQTLTRQTLQDQPGGESRAITDVVATQPGFVLDSLGNI